ncbi:uncharacterized protein LOC135683065 isoform X7 [Rhopilema esculentum]|uniref:uncharacterized protein LOC135683065 isoform X7 n=1 Tax=Rhopilema esculentum TaxID=499914 RepID=UPI0031D155F7
MVSELILLLNLCAFVTSTEYVGTLTDPKGSGLNIVATGPGSRLFLDKKLDGNELWKIHLPPKIGTTEFPRKAINIESFKYPGYYAMASKDLKEITLEKPTDSDSKQRATFRENHKVRTNAYIYLLEGHEYEFMCNGKDKPWYMEIKTDDNTKFFADRCSFDFEELDDKKAKERLGKEAGKSAPAGGGGAGGLPGSGGKGDGGKGNFVKLFIPGPPGIRPTLGLKADLFQKVRVGMPPDQFIIKSPGLNGVEGTYSFESAKYPMFYLQRIGRDIYLEALKRNQDFYASATFKATPYINKKNRYFVSPYSQPEWFLGHLHVPPFYVRAMYNNNTAEFDLDVSWIFKYQKQKELFGLGTHHDLFRALIKLLSLVHGPLTASQESAIFQALHGNTDLTELGNSTAIMQLLQSQHNSLLLSQLATINGLQGVKPVIPPAADASALSDATTAAGSVAGATAGSAAGTNTGGAGGTSGGTSVGTSGGTSGGSVTDKVKTDNKPETEVVVEKYEPWSDWSSCSAQCGAGHQIRVRPCKVNAQTCTPLQQSQSCVAAAPCQPAGTVQASPQVVQTVPQVAQAVPPVVQAAPVAQATGGCPMTCGYDCNPTSCPLSCCSSSLVKKHHIAKVKHFKRKFERAIKHRGHHKQ